jgi:hypothetical protein
MMRFRSWRPVFVAIFGLAAALPATALEVEKYLPDDTDFVLSVNVKQILGSPAFAQHYQKQIDKMLKMEPVPMILKDAGFDPLKDADHLWVTKGKSCHEVETDPNTGAISRTSGGGVVIFVRGRFDAAKLEAKAEQLVRGFPRNMKPHKIGATPVYEISNGQDSVFFVALVDKTTAVAAPTRKHLVDILDKVAGKTQTRFQHPDIAKALKALDPRLSAEAFGLSDMIVGTMVASKSQNGKTTRQVTHTTLADGGLKAFHGHGTMDKDIQVNVVFTTTDNGRANRLSKEVDDWLKKAIEEMSKQVPGEKDFAALVEALKNVKMTTKDDRVTLAVRGEAPAGIAFFKGWFMVSTAGPAPAAIEKTEIKPQPAR